MSFGRAFPLRLERISAAPKQRLRFPALARPIGANEDEHRGTAAGGQPGHRRRRELEQRRHMARRSQRGRDRGPRHLHHRAGHVAPEHFACQHLFQALEAGDRPVAVRLAHEPRPNLSTSTHFKPRKPRNCGLSGRMSRMRLFQKPSRRSSLVSGRIKT